MVEILEKESLELAELESSWCELELSFKPEVGLVYMFNLIVGTGALTMPKAFATAGWLVSLVLLVFLGFMSPDHWKCHFSQRSDATSQSPFSFSPGDQTPASGHSPSSLPALAGQPFRNTDASGSSVAMGVNLFYFCIIIYLYGDLAIYAAAVPFSLMQAIFTLLLGPFTFFDVQKTKYLQILTSLMRWIAFAIMIVLALVRIAHGRGEGRPPLADLSGIRNLLGVCVYSFMCQHSLPSLLTPVSSKRHLTRLVLLDYVLILAFYGLLSFTAIFCFRGDSLLDMYTLNFARCDVVGLAAVRFFLGLFPVFTISTNFPIIAVTLRNNWKTLFHREGGTYPWVVDRVVFPTITLLPPVLVAFCTHDLESLVGITGAYAGTGIQYVIPAFLVYLCRKDTQLAFGYGTVNKHRSPFRHTFWVGFVLLWAFSCFFFVTANIVLSETKV
ncbi:hypothetical protein FD754_001137 [Muntiacus muntjak]|uniref:Amino acid transporter transmembrane domain-containing protein n=1 Tax=Muntiacus muntjak TaxID=9888 RepID=A0A5N3W5S7_MUNMU|nr:hypothetical protein FD754_001137 [Muntiacus muntjak]